MKVRFGDKIYEKNKRNGRALKSLCWDIFKYYLNRNESLSYQDIQKIFNEWHCNNNFVVLNESEWNEKTENLKNRYFEPIKYNDLNLYFTTQWGNNGADCDNIMSMLSFAKEQNYDIEVLDDLEESTLVDNNSLSKIKNIILYGSPGVGKTHNTNKIIMLIESGKNEKEIFKAIKENIKESIELDEDTKSRTKFITFHQSFGYEDFIEGFRPNEEGNIELVDGIFKNICKEAQDNLENSKSDEVFNF